ncbi:MAG: hypothetical protein CMI02_00920 [Oceanospirillaceae bacterium]|nr:hypothetical protein [Oceanospirillaceae bacterium]MBT10581.1 hypothetical protein [Oceanospirillaceae bacterium]|tara:strand:- start:98705 stop:99835 length:1131 start_codon:yes stop_codon:yes gene_type:complete
MKRLMIVLLTTLVLSGCPELGRHWSDQTETLYVDSYKVQCDDNASTLCFRVREDSSDSWETAPQDFTGFSSFEWGYRYTVEVETSFDNHGDPESYDFKSVIDRDPVTSDEASVILTLYTDTGILQQLSDTEWSLSGDVSFTCETFCSDLLTAVNNSYVTQLEFNVQENTVTLSAFICAAAEDDFQSECAGESEEDWYIAHFMSECGYSEPQLCYLYKLNEGADYELLPLDDGISDFEYEWGSRYDIRVNKTQSAAGNLQAAELIEENTSPESRIGSSYSFLFIVDGEAVNRSSGGSLTMYDLSETFDCGSYSLCQDINDYIEDNGDYHQPEYMLLRAYVDAGDVVILDVVCHDESRTDFRQCVTDEDEPEDINWNI